MTFVIIGALCIGYGIYVAIVRMKFPEKLGKYESMKNRFGESRGKMFHTIAYTVLPTVFGIIMIIKGTLP